MKTEEIYTNSQLETIENLHADFDTFLAKRDWKNAQAIIDALYDLKYEHEGNILRSVYLKAQAKVLVAQEDEIPTDWEAMRPSYPNE